MTDDEMIAKIQKLIDALESLPEYVKIAFDPHLDDDAEWMLEPITMSCDDVTIIGYMVTNKMTMH